MFNNKYQSEGNFLHINQFHPSSQIKNSQEFIEIEDDSDNKEQEGVFNYSSNYPKQSRVNNSQPINNKSTTIQKRITKEKQQLQNQPYLIKRKKTDFSHQTTTSNQCQHSCLRLQQQEQQQKRTHSQTNSQKDKRIPSKQPQNINNEMRQTSSQLANANEVETAKGIVQFILDRKQLKKYQKLFIFKLYLNKSKLSSKHLDRDLNLLTFESLKFFYQPEQAPSFLTFYAKESSNHQKLMELLERHNEHSKNRTRNIIQQHKQYINSLSFSTLALLEIKTRFNNSPKLYDNLIAFSLELQKKFQMDRSFLMSSLDIHTLHLNLYENQPFSQQQASIINNEGDEDRIHEYQVIDIEEETQQIKSGQENRNNLNIKTHQMNRLNFAQQQQEQERGRESLDQQGDSYVNQNPNQQTILVQENKNDSPFDQLYTFFNGFYKYVEDKEQNEVDDNYDYDVQDEEEMNNHFENLSLQNQRRYTIPQFKSMSQEYLRMNQSQFKNQNIN